MADTLTRHRIVVGVDGSAASAAAWQWAVREARLRDATVHLVRAYHCDAGLRAPYAPPSPATWPDDHDAAQAELTATAELARQYLAPGHLVAELVDDLPVRALLDRAAGAELLVLGTTRPDHQPGAPRPVMGPVARTCLRAADCPVVVVCPSCQPAREPLTRPAPAEAEGPGGPGPSSLLVPVVPLCDRAGSTGLQRKADEMTTLMRRDPKTVIPDLVDWFEAPFVTLRPYLAQPIRVEEYLDADRYTVRAELAGMDPGKDIEVTVAAGYLTIAAERSESTEGKHRSEFRYGSFTRSLPLPAHADEDAVTASYADGILTVTVGLKSGKKESAKKIEVTTGK